MGKVELDNELLKVKKATISSFSLITLTGISFTWDAFFGSNYSSSFKVWSKDIYSKLKFRLSSFDILPLIAFKLGPFLCFKIAVSKGSKIFKLKLFAFFLGKFSLVRISKFLTILLK